jgi:hypothetical protein
MGICSSTPVLENTSRGAVVAEGNPEFKPVFEHNHAITLPRGVTLERAREVLFGSAGVKDVLCLSSLADPASFEVLESLPWEAKAPEEEKDQDKGKEATAMSAAPAVHRFTITETVPVLGPFKTSVKLFVAQVVCSDDPSTLLYESRSDKDVWVRKRRAITLRKRSKAPAPPPSGNGTEAVGDEDEDVVVVEESFQGMISPMWASMAAKTGAEAHAKHMKAYASLFVTPPPASS